MIPLSGSPFLTLLNPVLPALPKDIPVYLVGGATRDALLGLPLLRDLDFVVPHGALEIGRRVADMLNGAFYVLDDERETARVILIKPDGSRDVLDFAVFRGETLEEDLRGRDFTINSIAVDVARTDALIDPLRGAVDLKNGVIRACSENSLNDDPIRILRGVRQATAFGFKILPETKKLMRQAVPLLTGVSAERVRDEVFLILEGPRPAASLQVLDMLGALSVLMPELIDMKGVNQPPPHSDDVWDHTVNVLRKLEELIKVLDIQHDPDFSANWALGLISVRLGRYRDRIYSHLNSSISLSRTKRGMLFLAALFHDAGKPGTQSVDDGGRIHFYAHDQVGAGMIAKRGRWLRLSNQEIQYLETIVRNHMRPLLLSKEDHTPSRRAVYRFFRDTDSAGVDVCLLSLADSLATYGPALPKEHWVDQLDVVRTLFDAWWEHQGEIISPPKLISGDDIINSFGLNQGPQVGKLLEVVREAQVSGKIQDREQAFAFIRAYMDDRDEYR